MIKLSPGWHWKCRKIASKSWKLMVSKRPGKMPQVQISVLKNDSHYIERERSAKDKSTEKLCQFNIIPHNGRAGKLVQITLWRQQLSHYVKEKTGLLSQWFYFRLVYYTEGAKIQQSSQSRTCVLCILTLNNYNSRYFVPNKVRNLDERLVLFSLG